MKRTVFFREAEWFIFIRSLAYECVEMSKHRAVDRFSHDISLKFQKIFYFCYRKIQLTFESDEQGERVFQRIRRGLWV